MSSKHDHAKLGIERLYQHFSFVLNFWIHIGLHVLYNSKLFYRSELVSIYLKYIFTYPTKTCLIKVWQEELLLFVYLQNCRPNIIWTVLVTDMNEYVPIFPKILILMTPIPNIGAIWTKLKITPWSRQTIYKNTIYMKYITRLYDGSWCLYRNCYIWIMKCKMHS